MPAKRTLPTRKPLSSRISTISPGMPKHIEAVSLVWSALFLAHYMRAHFYVGINLQHQDARRGQTKIANVEGLFPFGLEAPVVKDAQLHLAFDRLGDSMNRQVAAYLIAAALLELRNFDNLAANPRILAHVELALQLAVVEHVSGLDAVHIDLELALRRDLEIESGRVQL